MDAAGSTSVRSDWPLACWHRWRPCSPATFASWSSATTPRAAWEYGSKAVRGGLLLTGVALAAICTASAGPIAFVALVAPQIARRLVGGRSLALLPAAACGALLVVAADLAGRRVFAPTELPVGVITGLIGAPYFLRRHHSAWSRAAT